MANFVKACLFNLLLGGTYSIHPTGIPADVVAAVLVLPDESVAVAIPECEQLFVSCLVLQVRMLVQEDAPVVQGLEFAKAKKVLNAQLGHLLDIAVRGGCVEAFIQNLHLAISPDTVFVDYEGRGRIRVF